jgi:prephenate dehydrogenase
MKLGIVGLGLIGGSLALDLKAAGFAKKVVGVEADAANAEKALELGLVSEVRALSEAVGMVDLLIFAIAPGAIAKAVCGALTLVKAGATVTDMGSTKEKICRAAASHVRRAQFVASHPMAGTEDSGPTAALRGLFSGKIAVLCEAEKSGAEHIARVEEMYAALGMRLVRMNPDEHDLHVAYVSHLSHISSFVLANTVITKETDSSAIFNLAGGGFASTVRLAKSSPETWASIFTQNRAYVLQAIDDYMAHLREFRRAIVARDETNMKKLMLKANRIRRVLKNMDAGKITPPRRQGPAGARSSTGK